MIEKIDTASTLKKCFESADGEENGAVLEKPGAGGLAVLLISENFKVTHDEVQKVMDDHNWPDDHTFTWADFLVLAEGLRISPTLADEEETAEVEQDAQNATEIAHIVDVVAERLARNEVPAVLPVESNNSVDAKDILQMLEKVEHVEVQSFMDLH